MNVVSEGFKSETNIQNIFLIDAYLRHLPLFVSGEIASNEKDYATRMKEDVTHVTYHMTVTQRVVSIFSCPPMGSLQIQGHRGLIYCSKTRYEI